MNEYAKSQVSAKAKAAACPAPTAYGNGSALVLYNSTSYRDDLVWAAAWLYKATGEPVRASSGSGCRSPKDALGVAWVYKANGEPVRACFGFGCRSPKGSGPPPGCTR